jgi:excisionase family DNA binding protein
MADFTAQEMAEIETLTLTKKIARDCRNRGPMTAKEVAKMLGISPKIVFKLARAGRIPSFRIGTAVRFEARLVIDWLRQQRTGCLPQKVRSK